MSHLKVVQKLPITQVMRTPRPVTPLVVVAALAAPASANALLGLPLPLPDADLGQVVTQVGDTVGGVLPGDVGGVVTGATDQVGGIVSGTTDQIVGQVTGTVDQVLGGVTGTLPVGTVDQLLGTLGAAGVPGATTAAGGSVTPGTVVLPDGTVLVDQRAPGVKTKVLSTVRQIARTGKMRLAVTSDEPSVLAVGAMMRPGKARTRHHRAHAAKSRRSVIHLPAITLAYRKAGTLKLTYQLKRRAQRNVARGRNARISVAVVAVDVARNQAATRVKSTVRR